MNIVTGPSHHFRKALWRKALGHPGTGNVWSFPTESIHHPLDSHHLGPPTGVPWIFPPPFPADATTTAQAEGLCCSVPEGEPTGFGSPCMLSFKVSQPPQKKKL